MTEDEMVGWHHRLNGYEFEQTLGDGEGRGNLACCSPQGCKESDVAERLNSNESLTLGVCFLHVETSQPASGVIYESGKSKSVFSLTF